MLGLRQEGLTAGVKRRDPARLVGHFFARDGQNWALDDHCARSLIKSQSQPITWPWALLDVAAHVVEVAGSTIAIMAISPGCGTPIFVL
jgi:hypothetical protein